MLIGGLAKTEMSPDIIDIIREIVHEISLLVLVLTAIVLVIGFVKPHLLRKYLKEFAERKYIIVTGVFVGLLSATIFTATQSMTQPPASETVKPAQEQVKKLPASEEPASSYSNAQPVESADQKIALNKSRSGTPSTAAATDSRQAAQTQAESPKSQNQPANNDNSECKDKSTAAQIICRPLELLR